MASYVPAKKNVAFILYTGLTSQADTKLLQSNPTIASGDFKVSIDGGALANLATLPTVTPASSKMVKISLSSGEMNGDNITIVCFDVAGAEWCDLLINLQTAARQIDDLAYPATSGRSMVVDAAGLVDANAVKVGPTGSGTAQTARDIGASVLLSSGTGTGQLDITSGVVKANLVQILATALTETAGLLAGGFKKFFNVAAPTLTCLGIDQTGDSYARVGAPVGASISADVAAVKAQTASIQTDTDDIQTRIPAALVSGRMDSSVGAIAANAITATAIASDAITSTKVADGFLTAAKFASGAFDAVWTVATRTLSAFSTALAVSVWDVLASAVATASSIGLQLKTDIDATISSRLATAGYTAPGNSDITAIKTQTDKLAFTVANQIDANVLDWKSATAPAMTGDAFARLGAPAGASVSVDVAAVKVDTAAIKAKTDNLPASPAAVSNIPTALAIADQVWEETLADHSGTSGSTAAALNAAGGAGDPWGTALPGAYGAGSAGKIIGDNINAAISSRASESGGNVAAIKAKTDNLPAAPAATSDIPSAASIATVVWDKLTSALTTVGSIGKLLVDNVNATISSRLSSAGYTAPDNSNITAIKAKTDNLPSDPADESSIQATLATLSTPAQVHTEVVNALNVDTYAEPGQGTPAATTTLVNKIGLTYKAVRNKVTQDATTAKLYADNGTTVDQKAAVTDDGATFTRNEFTSGP